MGSSHTFHEGTSRRPTAPPPRRPSCLLRMAASMSARSTPYRSRECCRAAAPCPVAGGGPVVAAVTGGATAQPVDKVATTS